MCNIVLSVWVCVACCSLLEKSKLKLTSLACRDELTCIELSYRVDSSAVSEGELGQGYAPLPSCLYLHHSVAELKSSFTYLF